MSETETVPFHRFTQVNDKLKAAEARVVELEAQAKLAEKLATQVETLKGELKSTKDSHAAQLTGMKRHEVLRDKGVTDPEVRDLFLAKMGAEVEDVGKAFDAYYEEGAEVPSVLKPFLPERGGDAGGGAGNAGAAGGAGGPTRRLPGATGTRSPGAAQQAITAEQARNMSNEELAAMIPALAQQTGNASLLAAQGILAPKRASE